MPSRIGWAEAHSHRDRPFLQRDPLRVYATRAVLLDLLAVVIAAFTGFILRWTIPYSVDISDLTYVSFVGVVVASWMVVLVLRGAYDTRVLGVGSEEFKRVVSATAVVFAAIALVAFALKLELSRGFVLITFVVGVILLISVRWILRAWLRHERRYGHFLHRTVVIGSGDAMAEIVDLLDRDPVAGFAVVDVIPEIGSEASEDALESWLDEVMTRIALEDADTVAVAGAPAMGPKVIQRLAWRLEGPRVDLLVAPTVGGGAADVTAVDLDEVAIAQAKRNANLNQARIKFVHADAFAYARQMQQNGEKWDVVMLDPPKFIFTRDVAGNWEGRQKYEDLNILSISLVKPGGIFVTCSCSGLLSLEDFEAHVIKAAHRLDRRLQFLDRTGPGSDHPVFSNCLESRYLKVLWARVV